MANESNEGASSFGPANFGSRRAEGDHTKPHLDGTRDNINLVRLSQPGSSTAPLPGNEVKVDLQAGVVNCGDVQALFGKLEKTIFDAAVTFESKKGPAGTGGEQELDVAYSEGMDRFPNVTLQAEAQADEPRMSRDTLLSLDHLTALTSEPGLSEHLRRAFDRLNSGTSA